MSRKNTAQLRRSGRTDRRSKPSARKAKRVLGVAAIGHHARAHVSSLRGQQKPQRVSDRDLLLKELRTQIARLEQDNARLLKKCERLEEALLREKSPAGRRYAERTAAERDDQSRTTAPTEVSATPFRTRHQSTLEAWNKLTAEQQDEIIAKGQCWNPGEEPEEEETTHGRARQSGKAHKASGL